MIPRDIPMLNPPILPLMRVLRNIPDRVHLLEAGHPQVLVHLHTPVLLQRHVAGLQDLRRRRDADGHKDEIGGDALAGLEDDGGGFAI